MTSLRIAGAALAALLLASSRALAIASPVFPPSVPLTEALPAPASLATCKATRATPSQTVAMPIPLPAYPAAVRAAGIGGLAQVTVHTAKDGSAALALTAGTGNGLLDAATMAWARANALDDQRSGCFNVGTRSYQVYFDPHVACGSFTLAHAVRMVPAAFPPIAAAQHIHETVNVRIHLDVDGSLVGLKAEPPKGNALLERSALAATAASTFAPSTNGCVTVSGYYVSEVIFDPSRP
ncbi:MAG TPA: energy transducer TonB [Candidatus Dormibacteraeota bacterium]|nr:energy transducer TonB [Candidatus Dormibacteraeota bacterium]